MEIWAEKNQIEIFKNHAFGSRHIRKEAPSSVSDIWWHFARIWWMRKCGLHAHNIVLNVFPKTWSLAMFIFFPYAIFRKPKEEKVMLKHDFYLKIFFTALSLRCGTWAQGLTGSILEALGFTCPTACRISVPPSGINLCPLHWVEDS